MENRYNESFNGTLEHDLPKREIFRTLTWAQVVVEQWRRAFTQIWPHSALGNLTPSEYILAGQENQDGGTGNVA